MAISTLKGFEDNALVSLKLSLIENSAFIKVTIEVTKAFFSKFFKELTLSATYSDPDNLKKLTPAVKKVGDCAKIYAVFYGSLLVALSALFLSNQICFTMYAKLMLTACALNIFIQLATPLYNLRKVKKDRMDPFLGFRWNVCREIGNKINEQKQNLAGELKPEILKLERIANYPDNERLIKNAAEASTIDVTASVCAVPLPITPPPFLGMPEIAAVVHTVVILLVVTLAWRNFCCPKLIAKIILGTVPLGMASSLFLQRTLEKRILEPMKEFKLSPQNNEHIRKHLLHQFNHGFFPIKS